MGGWVVVGDNAKIATSPDGITWTQRTSSFFDRLLAVARGGSQWVAVGESGMLGTSPDGITWTIRTSSFGTSHVRGVAWNGSQWVAVGSSGKLATSPDGVTWTQRTSSFGTTAIRTVAWGGSLWVAVGDSGKLATSTDGVSWTQRSSSFGATTVFSVAWDGTQWVAVGESGKVATSPDGMTWTQRTSTFGATAINAVAASGSLWVAAGDSGKLATSPDGITWTDRTSSFGSTSSDVINTVAWNGAQWLAVGGSTTGGKIATSTDAITWTQRTSTFGATEPYIRGAAWAANAAPNAPTLTTMASGETVDKSVVNRAGHTPSDPDTGDSQSAFDLRYRTIGAGTWTDVYVITPNPWYDFAADSLAPGDYERQVRTYDSQGAVGPYSASGFFTVAVAPPAPTFTDPINGQIIGTGSYTATISAPNVDASEWRSVADDGFGNPDTSTIYSGPTLYEGAVRSHTFTFPVNNRTEHLQSRIQDAGLFSQWADNTNPISYTPPPTPTATLAPDPDNGALIVGITNPAAAEGEPAVAYNDVYVDDGSGSERKATMLATNTTWTYWLPIGSRDYAGHIRVVAVATNGTSAEGIAA